MGQRSVEIRHAVRDAVRAIGGVGLAFSVTGSGHQKASFTYEGLPVIYFFASTFSDARTVKNSVAGVKREARRRAAEGTAVPGAAAL